MFQPQLTNPFAARSCASYGLAPDVDFGYSLSAGVGEASTSVGLLYASQPSAHNLQPPPPPQQQRAPLRLRQFPPLRPRPLRPFLPRRLPPHRRLHTLPPALVLALLCINICNTSFSFTNTNTNTDANTNRANRRSKPTVPLLVSSPQRRKKNGGNTTWPLSRRLQRTSRSSTGQVAYIYDISRTLRSTSE
ncbi:hypothetical protein B0T10DRAFT_466847 [Thelonectria olida]|uniref:Uncharacterized protein n=1 Tax=Thelonectria olida TaxID=1576542 RepID=A0A9P8VR73_9HYPO|nr:hypothetical protein B0T10DRAFT_466847 [Thelonectria olida]